MASEALVAQSPPSDNDGGERPVRQQLKQTNLDSVSQNTGSAQVNRKRSLGDTDGAADEHPTKRSRECTPDDTKNSHNTSAGNSNSTGIPGNATPEDVSDSELDSNPPSTIPDLSGHSDNKSDHDGDICRREEIIPFKGTINLQITWSSATIRRTENLAIPVELDLNTVTGSVGLANAGSASVGVRIGFSIPSPPSPSVASSDWSSSPPSSLESPRSPNYPKPTVETLDSDYSRSSQNLEKTTGGTEDDSSQPLKKKRSREQLEDDIPNNAHAAATPAPSLTKPTSSDEKSTAEGQPEKKRPRDNSEERKTKVDQNFTASAFGKASTGSPFALNASDSAASPFAMSSNKSAFGASPFAASGASATGFGAPGSAFSAFGSAFPAPSGKLSSFASANAPSSFSGTAGKLSSFASPNAPASFGDSKDKTLGATKPDKEESDNESEDEGDDTFVAEKTDERFHERYVETGEENEVTEYQVKGKLYYFDDKKWKERGAGTFKVNLKTERDGKKYGRMIMRADGAHRVMLNSAIWDTMPFGVKGERPTTKDIYLASKEDEKVSTLLLRLGNEKQAGELFDVLKEIIEQI